MGSNFHKMKKEIRNNGFVYFNSRLSCAKDYCVSLTSTQRQGLLVLKQAAILCHHLSTADPNCWAEVDFTASTRKMRAIDEQQGWGGKALTALSLIDHQGL